MEILAEKFQILKFQIPGKKFQILKFQRGRNSKFSNPKFQGKKFQMPKSNGTFGIWNLFFGICRFS